MYTYCKMTTQKAKICEFLHVFYDVIYMYTLYAVIIFSMFISQGKSCYTSAAHTAAATGTL